MDSAILKKIEDGIPSMTKTQQVIALAILSDPLSVAFSTVHDFAAKTGVSPASVVRFSQQFSGGGFPELQSALKEHIQAASNPVRRMELNFMPDSDEEVLVTKIYEAQLGNLRSTFNRAFINSAIDSVELIAGARHIYTFGSRGSRSVAYYLGHHLNRVFSNADLVADDDRIADYVLRTGPEDVAIIFGLPRYSSRLLATAKLLRERGVKIITINDSPNSPFVPLSTVSFYVSYHSSDFHNSQLSSMLLAEILISLSISKDRETALDNLGSMENGFTGLEQFTDKR